MLIQIINLFGLRVVESYYSHNFNHKKIALDNERFLSSLLFSLLALDNERSLKQILLFIFYFFKIINYFY